MLFNGSHCQHFFMKNNSIKYVKNKTFVFPSFRGPFLSIVATAIPKEKRKQRKNEELCWGREFSVGVYLYDASCLPVCVMPVCVMPMCVMPFFVFPICVIPVCVILLSVKALRLG